MVRALSSARNPDPPALKDYRGVLLAFAVCAVLLSVTLSVLITLAMRVPENRGAVQHEQCVTRYLGAWMAASTRLDLATLHDSQTEQMLALVDLTGALDDLHKLDKLCPP